MKNHCVDRIDSEEDLIFRCERRKYFKAEPFCIDGENYTATKVWDILSSYMTKERKQRILEVCAKRSHSLVPVLENIYDRGNISAVMRSAEAFGFYRFYLIHSKEAKFKAANRVTKGTDKWLQVEISQDSRTCIEKLKKMGYQIYATDLHASKTIEEIDFSCSTAVIFGNEKEGVSQTTLSLVDGTFLLPMQGFAQSFNISVAAALTFSYAYYQQKENKDFIATLSEEEQRILSANYALRSFDHPEKLLKELELREKNHTKNKKSEEMIKIKN